MRYKVISSKNLEPSTFSTVLTGLARAAVTRQVRMRSFMVVKTYGRKQIKKHQVFFFFLSIFFFFKFIHVIFIYLFIYLFLAVLGLCFCARAFSSCGKRGPLFIAVRGPLIIAASQVAEHRLQARRLSNCGSRA